MIDRCGEKARRIGKQRSRRGRMFGKRVVQMGYNKENYRRIRREFEEKHLAAKRAAEERREELHRRLPEVAEIDRALSQTGLKLFREAAKGAKNLNERIAAVQKENQELQAIRADILTQNGYPADYSAVHYECAVCSDTGFDGEKICRCMKKALIMAGYESSGIGHLMRTQSFETFTLDYYKDSCKRQMSEILRQCRKYAENFESGKADNLFFYGTTGLGKTHLSTSIAKAVIDKGYDVVYDTAQNVFSDFEYERFNRGYNEGTPESRTDRYFQCDLLILDDLGAEMTNQFTVSCLYNLLNTRLNLSKAVIISTNLTHAEMQKRYADRILSRLLGEYRQMPFVGEDIRMVRLRM